MRLVGYCHDAVCLGTTATQQSHATKPANIGLAVKMLMRASSHGECTASLVLANRARQDRQCFVHFGHGQE